MSTLADLQRRNLAKMESSNLQDANSSAPDESSAPVGNPSNEVSIIPSFNGVNDASHDEVITPSITQSVKPSRARLNKASPKATESEAPQAGARTPTSEATGSHLKDVLDAQLRAHLMEQLMPAGGKGPVTRLNVEMPEELHQRLKQHCVKTRTPIKALINALIALYLEEEGEA